MHKAILIDAEKHEVKEVEVGDYKTIYPLLKCDLFECVGVDKNDTLYVDEEGLLKPQEHFLLWYGKPLAGNALLMGTKANGESKAPTHTIEEVKAAVKFLSYEEIAVMSALGFFRGM